MMKCWIRDDNVYDELIEMIKIAWKIKRYLIKYFTLKQYEMLQSGKNDFWIPYNASTSANIQSYKLVRNEEYFIRTVVVFGRPKYP